MRRRDLEYLRDRYRDPDLESIIKRIHIRIGGRSLEEATTLATIHAEALAGVADDLDFLLRGGRIVE